MLAHGKLHGWHSGGFPRKYRHRRSTPFLIAQLAAGLTSWNLQAGAGAAGKLFWVQLIRGNACPLHGTHAAMHKTCLTPHIPSHSGKLGSADQRQRMPVARHACHHAQDRRHPTFPRTHIMFRPPRYLKGAICARQEGWQGMQFMACEVGDGTCKLVPALRSRPMATNATQPHCRRAMRRRGAPPRGTAAPLLHGGKRCSLEVSNHAAGACRAWPTHKRMPLRLQHKLQAGRQFDPADIQHSPWLAIPTPKPRKMRL